MFKIRSEQIRPFEEEAQAAFTVRVMNYLRENHADEQVHFRGKQGVVAGLTDEDLQLMVENALARAGSYGLTWKSALLSFVILMFVVAPNFDRGRYVASVLTDEKIPANRRLDIIIEEMVDEDWEKIAKRYDEKAWEDVVGTRAAVAASGGESK